MSKKALATMREEWEQDKARLHYFAFVREVMSARAPGCAVLDGGTGWAGRMLTQDGFTIADKSEVRPPLAVSFDTLLCSKDPLTAIADLATKAEIVIFDLNARWPVIKGVTFAVDVDELTTEIQNNFTILSYKTYNHYAHLFAILGMERKEKDDGE